MRKLLALLFFKMIAMPISPMGAKEPPRDYVDLGTVSFAYGSQATVKLPYYKPKDVEKILTPDTVALHVIELIVDGKVVEPHLQLGGLFEMAERIRTETVGRGEEDRKIEMYWDPRGGKHWDTVENRPSIRAYQYFPPKHFEVPLYYKIEYPAKEVFLIYSINYPSAIFPKYDKYSYSEEVRKLMDRRYYAKWRIEWDTTTSSN